MPRASTLAESIPPVVEADARVAALAAEFEDAVLAVRSAPDGATAFALEGRRLRAWAALEGRVFDLREERGYREWHRTEDGTVYGLAKTSKCGWGLVRKATDTKGAGS